MFPLFIAVDNIGMHLIESGNFHVLFIYFLERQTVVFIEIITLKKAIIKRFYKLRYLFSNTPSDVLSLLRLRTPFIHTKNGAIQGVPEKLKRSVIFYLLEIHTQCKLQK